MEFVGIEYFGVRWDAPILDNGVAVETPVGLPCVYCDEHIRHGDQGIMRLVVALDEAGQPLGMTLPAHRECDLRAAVGSLAHLRGECSCTGHAESPFPGTLRQEAQEVLALVDGERRLEEAKRS